MVAIGNASVMSRDEARACIKAVNSNMADARAKLVELHDRKGWLALGYTSWRDCVVKEFGKSQATLYRMLEAGRVEATISHTEKTTQITTTTLRALGHVAPEDRQVVVEAATVTGRPTPARVLELANKVEAKKGETGRAKDALANMTPEEKRIVIESSEADIEERGAELDEEDRREDIEAKLTLWGDRLSTMRRQAERFLVPIPRFVTALDKAQNVLAEEWVRLLGKGR